MYFEANPRFSSPLSSDDVDYPAESVRAVQRALWTANYFNPRKVIDGQIYGVGYSWGPDNLRDFPTNPNTFLSVLVFDTFAGEPTWENIRPFMMQYATLYPFMDSIFMLSDPTVYQQNIDAFKTVLSYPVADPRYMPVTRDMSSDKRELILKWLAAGAPGPSTSTG